MSVKTGSHFPKWCEYKIKGGGKRSRAQQSHKAFIDFTLVVDGEPI